MAEAGAEAVRRELGDLGGLFSPDELALRVYVAMVAAGERSPD